ncbi:MAG: hypothetical protein V1734_05600 [Nanoarchaeota archaeon]
MSLEKEVNKLEAGKISEMAETICDILGYSRTEVDEIGQGYTDYHSYNTKAFNISFSSDCGPTIRYDGKLVFSAVGEKYYRRHGNWEEQFGKLYSRAVNAKRRHMRKNDIPHWIWKAPV